MYSTTGYYSDGNTKSTSGTMQLSALLPVLLPFSCHQCHSGPGWYIDRQGLELGLESDRVSIHQEIRVAAENQWNSSESSQYQLWQDEPLRTLAGPSNQRV
jgi:hypothetical protein